MHDNESTKIFLIQHLNQCIEAHNAGEFQKLNDGYDFFEENLINDDPNFDGIIFIASHFWREWIISYQYKWKYSEGSITKNEWPVLAQNVIDILRDRDVKLNRKIADGFGSNLGKNFSGYRIRGDVLFFLLIVLVIIIILIR